MVLSNKSLPVPPRINMLNPSSNLKPFAMSQDKLCLCFEFIAMSAYNTVLTRHSPKIKHWREG